MKTILGNEGHLSNKQIVRLGGLIAFVCDRLPYEHILTDLITNGFILKNIDGYVLTDSGQIELRRLTSMAGLRQENFTDKK
tara:strand:- start:570 stop:812 length:243 start_codon:yes stop_codon:yes gene_type:complete